MVSCNIHFPSSTCIGPKKAQSSHNTSYKHFLKTITYFTIMLRCIVIDFYLNNQPDALIIQIYSVIKLYMFRASSLPIIRSSVLYIRHW